ncbi:polar amino acid transport system substrate-binding protein [Bradyrhizobium sp. USDA 4524]|nr:ABC-type amino acid transport substrate-binding protein/cytochrome c5 [Bradyrhizobium sp. USDA 4538]MCP1900745.1 ABC-type amino acid transport substrate-binding protein/cytochrome c5 [Bradyrhizobium sp. USDA 4537]MCP1993599.1 ABC-type amino acid transport substrate-binding protein/cytochrome c5 [Bradyrhizobium sp. USDA 4539]MCP3416860.1 transporter substrate-binding domain-containing protein [Bradyrhizobium brasilense]
MPVSCIARNELRTPSRNTRLEHAIRTVLLSALLMVPALAAGADETKPPLRLCADPSNLPFSSDDPGKPGLYLEIGQAVAQKLGRTVSTNWYKSYFGKRTVRETLLSKQCDAMVGLPLIDDFMGPAVIFSKPIAHEGYALVGSKDRKLAGLDDLRGLRVAVQYQSTPQNLLALRDDIRKVTVLSPEEGMAALAQGKVDIAFIWAPVAGWLNKTSYGDKYQIVSTEGDGLLWATAIGFAKASGALRDEVDGVLPGLQGEIAALFAKYGVPNSAPVKFGEADRATTSSVGASEPVTVGQAAAAAEKPVQTAATAGDAKGDATAGREVFNGTCAHCHGPDAVQAERKIDLRLLKKRYADDMESTFWKTVHDGRPAKGMPAWKDVFSDDELRNVYVYLQSVQDTGGSN